MTSPDTRSWQAVRAEVIRRINEREWLPGELIPGEVELAEEFGCARATVNRALQDLAAAGLLDRRRKAGTRVALNPVRKAVLDVPVTREQIERQGSVYGHRIVERYRGTPPPPVAAQLGLGADADMLHLKTLHSADGKPFLFEDRWVNLEVVPEILNADLEAISANEWLVRNIPLTTGDIVFSAANATQAEAAILGAPAGAAIFVVERTTWNGPAPITSVRLSYMPGFRMRTTI